MCHEISYLFISRPQPTVPMAHIKPAKSGLDLGLNIVQKFWKEKVRQCLCWPQPRCASDTMVCVLTPRSSKYPPEIDTVFPFLVAKSVQKSLLLHKMLNLLCKIYGITSNKVKGTSVRWGNFLIYNYEMY